MGSTLERAWYDCGAHGNVMRFVRWEATTPSEARVYWFYYDTSDHLWMTVAATGSFDQEVGIGSLSDCVADTAAEYRYDDGRGRYLVRPRDPVTLAVLPGALWREYDANSIYGDCSIDPVTGAVTQGTDYLAGVGVDDPSASDMPAYFGSDQIGSTRAVSGTNAAGPPVLREAVYTAFGELVTSSGSFDTRYGYAGAWGYETAESFDPLDELGWLHVGQRYYDPSTGRFVQRDPIGIRGGLNVYEYAFSNPVLSVDPLGLSTWFSDFVIWITGGEGRNWLDDPISVRNASIGVGLVGVACAAAYFAPAIIGAGGKAGSGAFAIEGGYVWGPGGQVIGKVAADMVVKQAGRETIITVVDSAGKVITVIGQSTFIR